MQGGLDFLRRGTRPPQPLIWASSTTSEPRATRSSRSAGSCVSRAAGRRADLPELEAGRPAGRGPRPSPTRVVDAVASPGPDRPGRGASSPEGLYGRRKMTAGCAAPASGVCRPVDRPMRTLGCPGSAAARGPHHDPGQDGDRAGDLLDRDFTAAAPEPGLGHRLHLRPDVGRVRLRRVHRRRYAQRIVAWHAATTKETDLVMIPLRMALWQRDHEGHPAGRRRADPPLRRRLAIHLHPVHRAPRPGGHPALDRLRRRRLRQRPDGDHQRPLQDRVHPHHRLPRRPLQDHRRRRVRDRRLGRLVQQPPAAQHASATPPVEYEPAHYAALNREPHPV